jgi:hypothetical protein
MATSSYKLKLQSSLGKNISIIANYSGTEKKEEKNKCLDAGS